MAAKKPVKGWPRADENPMPFGKKIKAAPKKGKTGGGCSDRKK
jgi:hypothetical protein